MRILAQMTSLLTILFFVFLIKINFNNTKNKK